MLPALEMSSISAPSDDAYYCDLESRVRETIPEERYGISGYVTSEDHNLVINALGEPFLEGPVDPKLGYNCYIGNAVLYGFLDRDASFDEGKDSRSIFSNHFFCKDGNGEILDAVPLYLFHGEMHTIRSPQRPAIMDRVNCINPLSLEHSEKGDYVSILSKPFFSKDMKSILSSYDRKSFSFSLVNIELETDSSYFVNFSLDLDAFRDSFNNNLSEIRANPEDALTYMLDEDILNYQAQVYRGEASDKNKLFDVAIDNSEAVASLCFKASYMLEERFI